MSETSNNNENKKVVIELDNVRRDFLWAMKPSTP